MLSQARIKHLNSLKIKKFRDEHGQFIAEGQKLVYELICSNFVIDGIYASADWIVSNLRLTLEKKIPVFETIPREMDRISLLSAPGPVLAVVRIPVGKDILAHLPEHMSGDELILALDDIRDPGNMGTILRLADWFGIDAVLCSENCVEIYNPKVVQATMGSICRVRVFYCNLQETIQVIRRRISDDNPAAIPVYGTFLDGQSLYAAEISRGGVIVIGNESRGISPELQDLITRKLLIPSYGNTALGKAESLNASIAAAIVCGEFRRRLGVGSNEQ
jgi:TrmH family RNA methyltransferase